MVGVVAQKVVAQTWHRDILGLNNNPVNILYISLSVSATHPHCTAFCRIKQYIFTILPTLTSVARVHAVVAPTSGAI